MKITSSQALSLIRTFKFVGYAILFFFLGWQATSAIILIHLAIGLETKRHSTTTTLHVLETWLTLMKEKAKEENIVFPSDTEKE